MARHSSSTSNPATRDNLLALAARLFGTQGYSATTMRAIAEHAGIEAASIYYHFPSKEDLINEVMQHGSKRILDCVDEALGRVPAGATAEARFRAAVLGFMTGIVRHGEFALVNTRTLGQLPDTVRSAHVKRREGYQKLWQGLLEDLRAEGQLRAEVDLAICRVMIMGSVTNMQAWFNPRKGSVEKVAEKVCNVFFEGVRPRST